MQNIKKYGIIIKSGIQAKETQSGIQDRSFNHFRSAVPRGLRSVHSGDTAWRHKACKGIVDHLGYARLDHYRRYVRKAYRQRSDPWSGARRVDGGVPRHQIREAWLDQARQILPWRCRSRHRALADVQQPSAWNCDEPERGVFGIIPNLRFGLAQPGTRRSDSVDDLLAIVHSSYAGNPGVDAC